MTEMLLQARNGVLHFLPALPDCWPDGEVTGLRAKGGFTIDLEWKKGALEKAHVVSATGTVCRFFQTGVAKSRIPKEE